MAIMKASDMRSSWRQTSSAFSNCPSNNALVMAFSASDSDPVYIWNGSLVLAPLDADKSLNRGSVSVLASKIEVKRLCFLTGGFSELGSGTPFASSCLSSPSFDKLSAASSTSLEKPRWLTSCFLVSSEIKVSMTFQSALSCSLCALSTLDSQMLRRSPVLSADSKLSVAFPTVESASNWLIVTLDERQPGLPGSVNPTETSRPPKPKEAAALRSNHFGALGNEKVEACACD